MIGQPGRLVWEVDHVQVAGVAAEGEGTDGGLDPRDTAAYENPQVRLQLELMVRGPPLTPQSLT